jgi:hypothetical protein
MNSFSNLSASEYGDFGISHHPILAQVEGSKKFSRWGVGQENICVLSRPATAGL